MRKKIKRLCIDPIFGILTRPGLNEKLRKERRKFNLIFIDFNKIHFLNDQFGYEYVNTLFRKIFRTFNFRKTDLVARWFSGDEIVIITFQGEVEELYLRFKKHCLNHSLTFTARIYQDLETSSLNELRPHF